VLPLVVVLNPSEELRVYVDMRCTNEAVVRERHPIPTLDMLCLFGFVGIILRLSLIRHNLYIGVVEKPRPPVFNVPLYF